MRPLMIRLEQMQLNTKLLLGFGLILLLTMAVGVRSLFVVADIAEEAQSLYENDLLGVSHVKEANINLIYISRALRQMIIATSLEERRKAEENLSKAERTFKIELAEGRKRLYRAENKRLFDQFDSYFAQYTRNVVRVVDLVNQNTTFQSTAAVEFLQSAQNLETLTTTDDLLTALCKGKEKGAKLAAQRIAYDADQAHKIAVELLVAVLLLGLASSILISASIRKPIDVLRTCVQEIAAGRTDTEVPYQGYGNDVGALSVAVESLRDRAQELDHVRWIKAGAEKIVLALQGMEEISEFGKVLMANLTPLCGAQVGVFFVKEANASEFRLVGSWGYRERKDLVTAFSAGQGLVGQCVLEKSPIRITNVPNDYIRVSSALGSAAPRYVEVLPILGADGAVLAVVELGGFTTFSPKERGLLDEVLPLVALNLEIVARNQRTRFLLAETQRQAEVLRASEDELAAQNDELHAQTTALVKQKDELLAAQQVIEARTQELEAARTKAEQATATKSMFLANMSHEIRTPMNAIIGLSQLAIRSEQSPKQRDYLQKIHGAGLSLLGIINDILDFSKIENGRMDIEKTPFWLDDVFDSVATLVGQRAIEKSLEFLIHVEPGTPQGLIGDPLRLSQVLTNLVSNAVKFTEQGQIVVSVRLGSQRADAVQLLVSVKDTGIGMSAELCQRLFEAFSQADGSTTRKYGGSGLGLSISKRLVELMGGQIRAESTPQHGSTFSFDAWFGIAADLQRKAAPVSVRGLRALVVDDNPVAIEILSEQLIGLGMRIDAVDSGRACMAALERADADDPYRIVFMDWRMPGMDGVATTRNIFRETLLQHPPVVVMVTVFGSEDVRQAAEEAGARSFLSKPVSQSQLVDVMSEIFAPEIRQKAQAAGEDSAHRERVRGLSVLLVEDNEINQQIAVELLHIGGAQVTLACNGREALDLLTTASEPLPWSIVLMDLQMPVMDGHTATREIRKHPRFRDLPIVAMTAHALPEERDRCLADGMNDHITKPIDPDVLYRSVAEWGRRPAQALWQAPLNAVGVDVATALRRVSGNEPLYRSLLHRMQTDHADAVQQIHACLAVGDRDTAHRIAHTLKGVAGNIGAEHLAHAAARVARALIDQLDGEALQRRLVVLGRELDVLVAAAAEDALRILPATGVSSGRGLAILADPAERAEIFLELDGLLASCDAAAMAVAHKHAAVLNAALGADFAGFQSALWNFDFSAAAGFLAVARERSGAVAISV